jgi:hypothetical protein
MPIFKIRPRDFTGMCTSTIEVSDAVKELAKKDDDFAKRLALRRETTDSEFIDLHGSQGLQAAKAAAADGGIAFSDQCRTERVRLVFGPGFECLPSSQVLRGPQIFLEELTAAFAIVVVIKQNQFGDVFVPLFFHVTYRDGKERRGFGVFVLETNALFIPAGNAVFAIISGYNPKSHKWKSAQNPL